MQKYLVTNIKKKYIFIYFNAYILSFYAHRLSFVTLRPAPLKSERGGLESSGQRLIFSIGKIKRKLFFLSLFFLAKKVFKMFRFLRIFFWDFLRLLDFFFDNFWHILGFWVFTDFCFMFVWIVLRFFLLLVFFFYRYFGFLKFIF